MPPPDDYRMLRAGLLRRLAVAALLLGAGAGWLIAWLPAGTGLPRAPADGAPPAASVVLPGPGVPAEPAREPVSALADGLRSATAPERLEGKELEVMVQRPAGDAGPADAPAGSEGEAPAVAPPKLPKGPRLQVGIFALPANADELKRKLEAEGYPAYVETRVHVGPFANRKEAERVREKLKEQGTPAVFIPQ